MSFIIDENSEAIIDENSISIADAIISTIAWGSSIGGVISRDVLAGVVSSDTLGGTVS